MLVFFLARILFGGYQVSPIPCVRGDLSSYHHQSIAFFRAMYENRHQIPIHLHIIYGVGNLALNGLNMLWFSKMFAKMIARLHGNDEVIKPDTRRSGKGGVAVTVGKEEEEEKDPLLGRSDNGTDRDEGGLALPVTPPSPVDTVPKEAF